MLRSRAEIDAEPRTAQFVIERSCGGNHVPSEMLPLIVDVYLPPELASDYEGQCNAALIYRVARCEVVPKGRTVRPRPCVCEHMGHIIE
jgi:hypothetical protein